MRVLRLGKLPPDMGEKWATITCPNCGTEFEAQWKERLNTMMPHKSHSWHLNCSLCGRSVGVYATDFKQREPEGGRDG